MSRTTRFKISLTAALAFSLVGGDLGARVPARENLFFPTQALSSDGEDAQNEPITVIRGDEIEISFRIVEIIKKMLK